MDNQIKNTDGAIEKALINMNQDYLNKTVLVGQLQFQLAEANQTISTLIQENKKLNDDLVELKKGTENGENDRSGTGELTSPDGKN